ncbi:MAG TPA: AtpZ/AtpI family protein, partial [Planctomycetaceae bacterium]|nr:AtpZ/AtpI family protein [Planctomycetaceae bacterium]
MSERGSRSTQQRKDTASQIAQGYRTAHEIISAAMSMAVMAGGGYWLDSKFGWSPVLTIIGSCLGFVAAGASLRVLLRRLDRESAEKKKQVSSSKESQSR